MEVYFEIQNNKDVIIKILENQNIINIFFKKIWQIKEIFKNYTDFYTDQNLENRKIVLNKIFNEEILTQTNFHLKKLERKIEITDELKNKIKEKFLDAINYPMRFHVKLKENQDFVKSLEKYLIDYPEYETVNIFIKCICEDYKFKICEICHNNIPYSKRKNRFCSNKCKGKCTEITDKIKNSLAEIYNDPIKKAKLQNKIETTNMKRYGVKNTFQSPEVQAKIKQINKSKYGVENPGGLDWVQEKIKQTNKARYGTQWSALNPEIYAKTEKTNLEKYGNKSYLHCTEGLEKIHNTMQEKYGVDYAQQSDLIKQHTKENNIKNFGVEHPNFLKSWETILSWKDYIIPLFTLQEFKGYNKIYKFKCVKCR